MLLTCLRKNYSMYGVGIAQPLNFKYSYSADLLDLYKDAIQLINVNLTSRWKVRFRQTKSAL